MHFVIKNMVKLIFILKKILYIKMHFQKMMVLLKNVINQLIQKLNKKLLKLQMIFNMVNK